MCSRCDLSSRERVTINIQQPSNNWPTINLLSVYYSLSFSFFLSISLYLSLYVTFNHYPFTHHSQCRFTETLCVLQVGASSRRRAMALRWRNRPTAAQRSRTMTWKVGPPRILCLSLSPLEKKKKKSSILALLLLARFFSCPYPLFDPWNLWEDNSLKSEDFEYPHQFLCRRTIFLGPGCIENVCNADHFALSLPSLWPLFFPLFPASSVRLESAATDRTDRDIALCFVSKERFEAVIDTSMRND